MALVGSRKHVGSVPYPYEDNMQNKMNMLPPRALVVPDVGFGISGTDLLVSI